MGEKTNMILTFNNGIARKQKELEQCEARRIGLQKEVDKAVRDDSDKTLELGMILMAVQNLVQRCESKRNKSKRRRMRKAEEVNAKQTKEDIQRKGDKAKRDLQTIGQYLSDYEEIRTKWLKEFKNYGGAAAAGASKT